MKNVILLTIDTLRKDALGCYGSKNKLTPFIDSLEERCIKFTNMQATGPYTQASFPGILASSYYLEYGKEKKLSAKKTLISEALKKAGITSVAFHSNPYLCNYFGWNRIFQPDGSSKTFGEMTLEEKDPMSMRAEAFRNLKNHFEK